MQVETPKKPKSLIRRNIPWNALKTFKKPSGKFSIYNHMLAKIKKWI